MDMFENQARKARVFISCGQSKQSDEVEIARWIAARLQELGFDPYIAVEEQTLRGLKENIFAQLEKSEYFVFVDFRREQLVGGHQYCRGSLFSHQELALASYLDIPVLAFQEKGVKPDDGILRFLQANATPFSDRHLLPNVIADQVQRRGWDAHFRNELVLKRDPNQYVDVRFEGTQELGRFFYIDVCNLHPRKPATNCYAYLDEVFKLHPVTRLDFSLVEFKWSGYTAPNAHVLPKNVRSFDAFFIVHTRPRELQFRSFSDSSLFGRPFIQGVGDYELRYLVVSDNFPPARICVLLSLAETLDRTSSESSSCRRRLNWGNLRRSIPSYADLSWKSASLNALISRRIAPGTFYALVVDLRHGPEPLKRSTRFVTRTGPIPVSSGLPQPVLAHRPTIARSTKKAQRTPPIAREPWAEFHAPILVLV